MMTKNNIILLGEYNIDEKVVPHTYKIAKQFIVSNINYCIKTISFYLPIRKKVITYE